MAGISRLSKLSLNGEATASKESDLDSSYTDDTAEEEAGSNIYVDVATAQEAATAATSAANAATEAANKANSAAETAENKALESMDFALTLQNDSVTLIDNKITPVTNKLAEISSQVDATTSATLQAQNNMDSINSIIENIESSSNELQKKVEDMKNDIDATNDLISSSENKTTPLVDSMYDLLDSLEEQAQEITSTKDTQTIILNTMNDVASASAAYTQETDKSAVKWKQVYTASFDAYTNETPEIQEKIMEAYADLYGGYAMSYFVDNDGNILLDSDNKVIQNLPSDYTTDTEGNITDISGNKVYKRYCCSAANPKDGITLNADHQIDIVDAANYTENSAQGKLDAAKKNKAEALVKQTSAQKSVKEAQSSVDYYTNMQTTIVAQKNQYEKSLTTASATLNDIQSTLENVTNAYNNAMSTYSTATTEFNNAYNQRTKAQQALDAARETEKNSLSTYKIAENEVANFVAKYGQDPTTEALQKELKSLQDARTQAYNSWVAAQSATSTAETAYQTAAATYTEAQTSMSTAYVSYNKAFLAYDQAKAKEISAQSTVDNLTNVIRAYSSRLETIEENLKTANTNLDTANTNLEIVNSNLETASVNLDTAEKAVQKLLDGIHINYKSSIEQTAKGIKLSASKNEEQISALQINYDSIESKVEGVSSAVNLKQTDGGWTWSIIDKSAISYNQTFYKTSNSSSVTPSFNENSAATWSKTIPTEIDTENPYIWSAQKTAVRGDYDSETGIYKSYTYSNPVCLNAIDYDLTVSVQKKIDDTSNLINSQLIKNESGLYAVNVPETISTTGEAVVKEENLPAIGIGTSDSSGVLVIGTGSCNVDIPTNTIINTSTDTFAMNSIYNTIGNSGMNIYVDTNGYINDGAYIQGTTVQSLAASFNNSGVNLYTNGTDDLSYASMKGTSYQGLQAMSLSQDSVTFYKNAATKSDANNVTIKNLPIIDVRSSMLALGTNENTQIIINYNTDNSNITFSFNNNEVSVEDVSELDDNDDNAILTYSFGDAGIITSDLAKFPQIQSSGQLIIGNDTKNTINVKDSNGNTTSTNQNFVNGYSMRPLSDGSLGWFKIY